MRLSSGSLEYTDFIGPWTTQYIAGLDRYAGRSLLSLDAFYRGKHSANAMEDALEDGEIRPETRRTFSRLWRFSLTIFVSYINASSTSESFSFTRARKCSSRCVRGGVRFDVTIALYLPELGLRVRSRKHLGVLEGHHLIVS